MAILRFEDVSFQYGGSETFALSNINLEIERGEFTVICGESGCGKSTLLKLMKRQLTPKGKLTGSVLYNGRALQDLDERAAACEIGFVMQNPENQIVTDKVWHELAFGLESLGEKTPQIRRRVAEISGYFGIGEWYHKRTDELSGGQKQLLNLASVMAMNPEVLILDEPTSQLDPIAASEFISTLKKLNDELGLTVIVVEHRLEEVFPIADKVVVMNRAGILLHDEPKKIVSGLAECDADHKMNLGLPAAVRIYRALEGGGDAPLTVKEGKSYLFARFDNHIRALGGEEREVPDAEEAVEISEAWFRYERNAPDVLGGLSLTVHRNEILCILGANGAGKTTLLNVLNGMNRIYRGKLRIFGKRVKDYTGVSLYRRNVASLPQNPQLMFVKNKLYDDLAEVTALMEYKKEEARGVIVDMAEKLGIGHLLERHPFDLSGGEQQKAAFAKMLLLEPKLLLLDEPTKGIDAYAKSVLAGILRKLKEEGRTVVIVTHDVEFAAEHADRCAMFFDGQIVSIDRPESFFSENSYYTTSASRMSRELYDRAVTVDEVVALCRLNGERV